MNVCGGILYTQEEKIQINEGEFMLAEKRFEEIVRIVNERQSVTVQELMLLLDTSESTIRRDLITLDEQKRIVKVYGGALSINSKYRIKDDNIDIRKEMNVDKKIKIAKYAAALINSDDFVYIDAGSTTEKLIEYITAKAATFVTNSATHAKKLATNGLRVFLLGGEYKLSTEAVVGSQAIINLDVYNFTIGFWGTNGVNKVNGFTTPDTNEALTKKKAMEKCKNRYVICDSSKFDTISPIKFADFTYAKIITDRIINPKYQNCSNILEVDIK